MCSYMYCIETQVTKNSTNDGKSLQGPHVCYC